MTDADVRTSARSASLHRAGLVALAVAAALCFAGIFQHGLWAPDEPREAQIGREMLASRFSAMPTLSGEPFLEKPPLFLWAMAAFYGVFGETAGVARMPAALFSIGAAWIAYLLGRRAGGRLAGLASACALLTMNEFASTSHRALNDTALTFFVAAGHLAFLRARDDLRGGRRSWAFAVAGLCTAAAFLTKGVIGPALLAGPPVIAAAALREWTFLRRAVVRGGAWCVACLVVIAGPWVLALAKTGGWSAVYECLVHNTVGRAAGGRTESVGFATHDNPPWYYLKVFPAAMLPWAVAIPALLVGGTLAGAWRAGRARFLAVLVIAGVVLLSVPAGKRPLYVVPMLPAAAAVIGTWLARVGSRRGGRFDRATVTALLAVAALAAAATAYLLFGGPLPAGITKDKYDAMRTYHGATSLLLAAACAVAAVAVAVRAVRTRRAPAQLAARAAAVVFVVGFLAWHAVGRPFLDRPVEDLEDGALAVGRLVPADEPLLTLAPDETTQAVLPFYTRRELTRVPGRGAAASANAAAALASGPAHHLVILATSEPAMRDDLRKRLRLVGEATLGFDRVVRVYRWENR